MIRFDDRVAIVTGAGKGLGRAYAMHPGRTRRSRTGQQPTALARPSRRAPTRSCRPSARPAAQAIANYDSVEDPGAGERMVQQALDAWGRIDVLVNNAGVDQRSSFHKVSVEQFRQIFDINFYGSLYVTHAAYARMRAAGYGRIVVSTSNRRPARAARPDRLRRVESSADRLHARAGAAKGKSHNVLTNAIAPFAATPMTARQGNMPEEFMQTMQPGVRRARWSTLLVSEQTQPERPGDHGRPRRVPPRGQRRGPRAAATRNRSR